jgi:hypothetical protein
MAARRKPNEDRPVAPPPATDLPPVVASLRGILKNADPEAYRKHLVLKYR